MSEMRPTDEKIDSIFEIGTQSAKGTNAVSRSAQILERLTRPPAVNDIHIIRRSREVSGFMTQIEWPVSNGGVIDYYRSFQGVLRGVSAETSFSDLLGAVPDHHLSTDGELADVDLLSKIAERKIELNGSLNVLDLMGYGRIVRELGADGAAVGLENRKWSKYVKGDVLSPKTWQELDAKIDKHFDMIFCRPFGPVDNIPVAAYKALLERVYERLSSNDGLFLSEVGRGKGPMLKEVVEALNGVPGVIAKVDPASNTFMLIKQSGAPEKLFS